MESALGSVANKKMGRLKLLSGLWVIFMALVVAPAIFCTSAVEGESLGASFDLTQGMLHSFGAPYFLSSILKFPVALVAKILPVSTSLLIVPVMFLPFWLAAIVPMMICGAAEMPFYREKKFKIDPDWHERENEGVISKAAFGGYPLSGLVAFLVIVAAVGTFFIMPSIRTVIADNWVAEEVYIADERGRLTKIDATLNLKMFDPGYIVDKRPGVRNSALHLEFSGNDVDKLKAIGINDNFIEGRNTHRIYYQSQLCEVIKATPLKDKRPFGIGLPYAEQNYHMSMKDNVDNDPDNKLGCPSTMYFGISDFNTAQLAIKGATKEHNIVATLKRDSRWSWIEEVRVAGRFYENAEKALFENKFGYQK